MPHRPYAASPAGASSTRFPTPAPSLHTGHALIPAIPVGAPLVGALSRHYAPPPPSPQHPRRGTPCGCPRHHPPLNTPVGAPLVGALHAPNPARASRRPILDKERCSSRPFASLRGKRGVLPVRSRIAISVQPQYPDLTTTLPHLLPHIIINMPSHRIILPPLHQRIDLLRHPLPQIQHRPVNRPAHHRPFVRCQPAQQPRQ